MLHARDLYDNCEWPAAAIVNDNAEIFRHSRVEHQSFPDGGYVKPQKEARTYLVQGTKWYAPHRITVTLPALKLAA